MRVVNLADAVNSPRPFERVSRRVGKQIIFLLSAREREREREREFTCTRERETPVDPTHNTVEHQIRINEIEGGRRIQLSWLTSEFRLSGGRFYGRKRIWAVRSERVGSKGIRLNLGLRGAKGSRGWRAAPIRPRCEIMCVYVSHRDLHYSLFRLCCCPTEKWNIGWFTKTGLWKKKRFRALSRYLEGNGDNSKFSILFSINVLSPSFFFYYCEKSQKFVLHLLSWKRVYIRVSLLDIQYNIRFIQFQNRFIVIPSATLQFRFHLFRITLPNDFLYFLHYVMFSIQFVSFH